MRKKRNIIPNRFMAGFTRLRGAIFSGKRSAYLALLIKLVKPFTHFIDAVLASRSNQNRSRGYSPIPLMIISPPRSGSTIVFQSLARVLPGMYISNLHALFPRNASRWINNRNKPIPYKYKNYYGYTANIYDVYEGNEFIDPIFNSSQNNSVKDKFYRLIRKIKPNRGQTFVFKNVGNYNKVVELSMAIPETIFIRVKRQTEQVIQSEHRGYKDLKTFNPIPEALLDSDIKDPLEFNVRQILEIEREIDEQKWQIESSKWVEWEYEAFCEDPIGHIRDLAVNKLNIPESKLRPERLTYTLKASNRQKVTDEEAKKIKALINAIKKK